jgi:hypothetical protein
MSASGYSRRSDRVPMTSGLPRQADVFGVGQHVSNVPTGDAASCGADELAAAFTGQVHTGRH